jgi:hypothetical protein
LRLSPLQSAGGPNNLIISAGIFRGGAADTMFDTGQGPFASMTSESQLNAKESAYQPRHTTIKLASYPKILSPCGYGI